MSAGLPPLVDRFGRNINYVRLSVTDRCDLRCRYCMAEDMRFVPRDQLLSLEELAELAQLLTHRGVRRIRLTGGEPLVRRDVMQLFAAMGRLLGQGLDEWTITTNATRLAPVAQQLADHGLRRINISLDSLNADRFRHVSRVGDLSQVLDGIDAAARAGLKVKINMVALAGVNDDEIAPMLRWCGDRGFDLTLIETMPLGTGISGRDAHFVSLERVKSDLARDFTLVPTLERTGGPARYFDVAETGGRLGLITPLSDNFCAGCNRIRITATGTIYGCLGHDQNVELRDAFRAGGAAAANAALDAALAGKPQAHAFDLARADPAVARHMSVTGG